MEQKASKWKTIVTATLFQRQSVKTIPPKSPQEGGSRVSGRTPEENKVRKISMKDRPRMPLPECNGEAKKLTAQSINREADDHKVSEDESVLHTELFGLSTLLVNNSSTVMLTENLTESKLLSSLVEGEKNYVIMLDKFAKARRRLLSMEISEDQCTYIFGTILEITNFHKYFVLKKFLKCQTIEDTTKSFLCYADDYRLYIHNVWSKTKLFSVGHMKDVTEKFDLENVQVTEFFKNRILEYIQYLIGVKSLGPQKYLKESLELMIYIYLQMKHVEELTKVENLPVELQEVEVLHVNNFIVNQNPYKVFCLHDRIIMTIVNNEDSYLVAVEIPTNAISVNSMDRQSLTFEIGEFKSQTLQRTKYLFLAENHSIKVNWMTELHRILRVQVDKAKSMLERTSRDQFY